METGTTVPWQFRPQGTFLVMAPARHPWGEVPALRADEGPATDDTGTSRRWDRSPTHGGGGPAALKNHPEGIWSWRAPGRVPGQA